MINLNLIRKNHKDYNDSMDKLLENIHTDYANWSNRSEYDNIKKASLYIKPGRKFDKVVRDNSVWGFVAKTDGVLKGIPYFIGDTFKAASWRAPAKHVRGSIFLDSTDWFSWTGPNYL